MMSSQAVRRAIEERRESVVTAVLSGMCIDYADYRFMMGQLSAYNNALTALEERPEPAPTPKEEQ